MLFRTLVSARQCTNAMVDAIDSLKFAMTGTTLIKLVVSVMTKFDNSRLREINVSQAGLSKLRLYPKVYPYAFWVWQIPEVQRQGGMVAFRGDCRREAEGMRDVKAIHWHMSKFIRTVGGIDGLVVQTDELEGDWHQRLTYLPASIQWPETFRVLYQVDPDRYEWAVQVWGEDRVRGHGNCAKSEMDQYLCSLPPSERGITVQTLADGLNVGLPAEQIDELIATSEQPNELYFTYQKSDGTFSARHVTVERLTGKSIRGMDHKDGKTKNFRIDRITEARYQEKPIYTGRPR